MPGKLIVITGFAGAGKDTMMNLLLEKRPDYKRVVTHTTRPKRSSEVEGIDYHFVKKSYFESLIEKDKLFEYVKYGAHYKGTTKDTFKNIFTGETLVWRIDMSRAAVLEETFYEKFDKETAEGLINSSVKFMLKTPSQEISLTRYKRRDGRQFSKEEYKKRLEQDTMIWEKYKDNFPHIIVNKEKKHLEAFENMLKTIDKR
jgi:guanylate kinase